MRIFLRFIGALTVILGIFLTPAMGLGLPLIFLGQDLFKKGSQPPEEHSDLKITLNLKNLDPQTAQQVRAKAAILLGEVKTQFGLETLYEQKKV